MLLRYLELLADAALYQIIPFYALQKHVLKRFNRMYIRNDSNHVGVVSIPLGTVAAFGGSEGAVDGGFNP